MTNIFLFNEEFLEYDVNKPLLPVDERATNFGDGVYEVVKIYNGEYYLLEEHLDRLYRSLNLIKINFNLSRKELKEKLLLLLEKNDYITSGHVYFQISRGSAFRGHLFPENTTPNFYAYLVNAERPFETMKNGVNAITVDDIRWLHCDIKSLNLLPNILAKQTAYEQGCYEAIQIRNNYITEGASSNIYVVKNNVVYTHPDSDLILPGVVKRRLLELCEANDVKVTKTPFLESFLNDADEVFLSSSTSEITPIVKVNNILYNNGVPGSFTRKLQKLYCNDAKVEIFF